jgi:hypothetical protein
MVIFKTFKLRAGTSALQRRQHLLFALILCILFGACPAYCSTTYFVQPDGSDSNSGTTINSAFKTITKGESSAVAGDTIYLRGGRHYYSAKISISKVGTSIAKFYLFAYPGDTRPILDFSAMAYDSSNRGISLSGQYWYMKGFDIYKAGDNGMNISGSNNIIEFCAFYENYDTGLQLGGGAANNQIINCDSYYNYDPNTNGGNADGFSPKLDVGTGNYFYGCRSWQNSDDAYDGYLNASVDVNTTYENCWAFKAGHLKDGSDCNGNGNGFKMGSSATSSKHNVILKNCLSFQNKAKGFDQNHNKGSMTLYNCTAFNNGGYNYSIYEALASGKMLRLTNDVNLTGGVNLLADSNFVVQTTNSWMSPFDVNNADFASIDANAAYGPRNADGSLPHIAFMRLAAGSDLIDGGTDVNLPYDGNAPDLGAFEHLGGDCQPSGYVDFADLACLAANWANTACGTCNGADFSGDNKVDFSDLAIMAENWLL